MGTLGMLIWLWAQLDLQALREAVVWPALLPLGGMIGTAWVFVLLGGVKFWLLCRVLTSIPVRIFMYHFCVATAFGAFTPAALGDFSLAALLRREHVPVHESMAVILVDRAVTMGMYAMVFVPLTFGFLLHSAFLWWVPVGVGCTTVLTLGLNSIGAVRQTIRRLLAYSPSVLLVDCLGTTSRLIRQHPWHLLGNIGLTFLRCLVSGLVVLCALWAAGVYPAFFPVLATTNTIAILNLLPVSLAGLGVYEGGGVALLGRLGLPQERVLMALVYQRLYVLLSSFLILAVASLYVGRRAWCTGHVGKPKHDPACASQL
ncbi:MAG: YbhN family protein [Candidatus Tectimicrobiota bacterium]